MLTFIPFRFAASAALSAAFAVVAVTPAPAQQQATPSQLVEAATALRSIATMQTDFVQTDRNGQRLSGVLTLKRPGRIRFQYERGVQQLIVSDGKALTWIDYQVRQVQRWPFGSSPLGVLLDPSKDVTRFGRVLPASEPGVLSIEVKDKAHREYGVYTLNFVRKAAAPGGLELVSWITLDSQNKRTLVQLANHRYGIAVPDNTFAWIDPRRATRR